MTELTPAEQAAADVMMGALVVPPGDIEEVAPDVVAAVREQLFRDPKERLQLAHELAMGSPTLTTAQALEAVDCALNRTEEKLEAARAERDELLRKLEAQYQHRAAMAVKRADERNQEGTPS